jgi:hypothetical protein
MRYRLAFNPEFYHDLQQAIDWYEEQKPGLGMKFYLSVKEQTLRLKTEPLKFAVRYDEIRCVPLKQFPYLLHYQTDFDNKLVKVEALLHTSRNPDEWRARK